MTQARDAAAGPELQRDRLSWMLYLTLGTYGYFLYAFGATVPLVRAELGLSRSLAGLHGTSLAMGSIVAGVFGTRLIARYGRDRAMAASSALLILGTLAYCTGHHIAFTLLGALLCGTGGSVLLNIANAVLMDRHVEAGPAAVSEANALGGGAGIVSPLIVGAAVTVGLGWRVGVLVTIVLVVVIRIIFHSSRLPKPTVDAPRDPADGRHNALPATFWITWGVFVCVIAVEFCLSLWVSDELQTRDGMAAGPAAAGLAAVLVGLTLSRAAGGRLGLRYDVDWLMKRSMIVLLVGFAGFWLATSPWVALPALLVCGLGLGMLGPLCIGRAVGAAGGRSDLALARCSLGGGLAIGAGPFLIGAIADQSSVHLAFLLVPTLLVAALAGLAISRPAGSDSAGGRERVRG